MKPSVLIGFADSLAAIESAWSLADNGFAVWAFKRSDTRPALELSRLVRVVPIAPPELDANKSVADLAALVRDSGATALLPLDDQAVWLSDRLSQLESVGSDSQASGVTIVGPTGHLAALALDKREQLRLAAAVGLNVPASCEALNGKPTGTGPWMVKPAMAVVHRDGQISRPAGRVAASAAEVREIAVGIGSPAVAQPLIEGIGEGVFGLATPRGVAAWSSHRRIRMMNPRGSGSSACRSIPVDKDLIEPVRAFISAAGWQGLFMIEVIRDTAGRAWFMELNGRTWGKYGAGAPQGSRVSELGSSGCTRP